MASFWKIAVPVTCVAVICGAAILWPVYKEKAIERKLAEAAGACRVRAGQGDAKAQDSLGNMYRKGEGVPRNYAEAVRWFRQAAGQGYPKAQVNLAFMYYQGQGVLQDYVQARMWLSLAAPRINADRDHDCVRGLDLVGQKMTAEQIAEAESLAGRWKPREQPTATASP